jgi:hypothetical protein
VTFADTDCSTGSVDEPCTLLHLGDEFLVEHTLCLLVERTIDGDNIGLRKHILETFDSSTADFLGGFGGEGLVIKVEKFLAVEGNKTSQDTFADTSDTDCGDDFTFEIERIFGYGCDVPVTPFDLFVSGDKVTYKHKHGENDYH